MICEECKSCPIKVLCDKVDAIIDETLNFDDMHDILMAIYDKGRADAIDEISRAMYHQCFECNNDENMQKWDGGNWFRYKLFENVLEQIKE